MPNEPEKLDSYGSWTVLHLFPDHYHCQLNNFDWSRNPAAWPVIEEFIKHHYTENFTPRHLFILGDPGVGKTHIGVGLYRWAVLRTDVSACMWLHMPTFCDKVKAMPYGDLSPFRTVEEATELVVIDDIFGRDLDPREIAQTLFRVIDIVQRNRASLVITDNHDLNYFSQVLKPHEVDRLEHNGFVLHLSGNSNR